MTQTGLLALDQGTSSSRAILFSERGEVLSVQQKELKLHSPEPGWVEQDPGDIWRDTLWAAQGVVDDAQKIAVKIAGIGITNQRETTIIWDRKTGEPVYNAIVWKDRRTADVCAKLKDQGHESAITAKTGLLLDPYFSATKIAWILDNVEGVRARAEAGDLAFGTVDSYLLWHLTGGKVHATDATNASRTMLFNIVAQQWDEELLELFNIPASLLPEVKDNAASFGTVREEFLGAAYKIGGMAGDQQAALIGQACFDPGMVKSTYGTGCFALMNIGPDFMQSQNQLLTTLAYRLNGQTTYAIEGSIFSAGSAVQWLRDELKIIRKAAESESLAKSVPDNGGVYVVPAFNGLGAPYWRPDVRERISPSISGIPSSERSAYIARGVLEAQGYQTRDLMGAMEDDSGRTLEVLRADGGLMANEFVCQFLADMLGIPVEIPHVTEATAWGAACLAGLQTGVFSSLEDISAHWEAARRYEPQMEPAQREALYSGWQEEISHLLS